MSAPEQPTVVLPYRTDAPPPKCPRCGASVVMNEHALALFRGKLHGYYDSTCLGCGLRTRLVGG